ncbi:TetR family transcriptional regulator [Kitasatospora arboriphila]
MAQQERARRTYEAVLDAAAREFAAHGYANTNLGHVAQSTGVTKGALYGHFASKEELAAALVQHLDDAWKLIEDGVGDSPDSPVATLKNVTCALVARLHRDIRVNAALRLLLEEAQSSKRTPPSCRTWNARCCAWSSRRSSRARWTPTTRRSRWRS